MPELRQPDISQPPMVKVGPPLKQRNQRLDRLGHGIQNQTALLYDVALDRIAEQLAEAATTSGGDKLGVSGGGATVWVDADEHGDGERIPVTSVEAIVLRRALFEDRRQEIREAVDDLIARRSRLDKQLRKIIGPDAAKIAPEICNAQAKRYEGYLLPWTPFSRDPDQGWSNIECRDIADDSGLCDTCRTRMNRWRVRRGIAPISVQEAA